MNTPLPNIPERCHHCRMHINLCFCNQLIKIENKIKVTVLMHYKEYAITTNTAHLIPKILQNADIRFHGHKNKESLDLSDVSEETETNLLLYPLTQNNILSPDLIKELKAPIRLFVPDGNWRQTARMIRRTPALAKMKKVVLPIGEPSNYHLRHGPTPHHLCTYEAISRALGLLEGTETQTKMNNAFTTMVNRVLYTRGKAKLK
ncbi:DTW domain-containing protein [bacterium]|nr:DTW domain-containing protein [bacterium]MBU1916823.1 DTW domain-containing protein [bacterium]